MQTIKTDYLIIGTGAVGMAFADTLLTETDSNIIMVDHYPKPGGHWNVAYPFVTLHQPSQFYGVNSRELSQGRIDEVGLNKGLGDLATGAEILSYFDDVMRQQFLPSGRVQYFPMCDYQGEGRFTHRLTGAEHVARGRKVVDCTFLKTSTPATHTPKFEIDADVRFVPVAALPTLDAPADRYVVIGGGKTGIDAILWLMETGVDPDRISWVISRDGWMLNRENTQPREEFFTKAMGAQAAQLRVISEATDRDDMFLRLEAAGVLLRLDPSVAPKMFHGATISPLELDALRRLKHLIRLGRVSHLKPGQIVLDRGTVDVPDNTVFVDCSATAIPELKIKPVFQGDLITPQTVRAYQPVFSAAFIAHIEARGGTEAEKNAVTGVVPLPDGLDDFLHMTAANMMNQAVWGQDQDIRTWLRASRLDGFSKLVANVAEDDMEKIAILKQFRQYAMPAMMNLQKMMSA